MDMAKIDDWLSTIPSEQTRKSYRCGIRRFEEFYQKPVETLINSQDAGKTMEKFYVWLKNKGKSQNTCRTTTNAPIQFLKYFNTPVKYRRNLGIYNTTLTTRDHMLNVDEAREMYRIGSLEEKVMVKTWLLGLRIGDACRLEWKQFNFKPTEDPKEVLVNTKKEGIVAHVFIDAEFQKLLAQHIPNLNQSNKFLFQSEKGNNLKEKQLLRKLQNLQKKARINAKGVFGWHIGRKLFMRTCAELGITSWNAKLMVGKAVDKSIATYINGVQLKDDATKVSNVLHMELSNGTGNSRLTKQLEDLQKATLKQILLMKLMEKVVSKEKMTKALEELASELGIKLKPANVAKRSGKLEYDFEDAITQLSEALEKKDLERILKENRNNNH
jgi:integrase